MIKKFPWLSRIEKSLQEISQDWGFQPNDFYYDRSSKSLIPSNGNVRFKSLKNILGAKFRLSAPHDARIYLREDKIGVIIVSRSENLVLKMFLESFKVDNLKREISVLQKVKGSDFEPFAPQYKKSGELQDGGAWLLTDAFQATDELNETKLFQDMMSLMRPMAIFYRVFGIQEKSYQEWWHESLALLQRHKRFKDLQKIMSLLEKEMAGIKNIPILYSNLHADLHKMNILSGHGKKIIIDWEGTSIDPIFQDYFDFLRRFLQKNPRESQIFWDFIIGKEQELPIRFQPFFENYGNWMKEEFNKEIPTGSARALFCIYCLQRTASLIKARGNSAIDNLVFESEKLTGLL